MRTLLAYRDARLLLAGQTLSACGDWAMLIVLAVCMKTLTGSNARASRSGSSVSTTSSGQQPCASRRR